MADTGLLPLSPLATFWRIGRHGRAAGAPGLHIQERNGSQIVAIAARAGQEAAISAAILHAYGLALPTTPRWVGDDRLAFVWAGPGTWHAVTEAPEPGLAAKLRECLGPMAALTEQGDGRVVFRASGPAATEVLATGIALDLHSRAFRTGDAARTLAGHIAVQIRKLDDAPSFEITAARSFAAALAAWLLQAGLAYGVDVHEPT